MRILLDEHDLEWGRRGRSPSSASPTPATPCCPRRSRSGRCPHGAAPAAPHGDHLPDQRDFVAELRETYPGDELRVRRMSIIADHPSARCAWPTWPRSRRSRSTAWPPCTASCSGEGAERLLRAVAGALHQCHQRRDAAPLHQALQPRAVQAHLRHHRQGWVANLDRLEEPWVMPTTRTSGRSSARSNAQQDAHPQRPGLPGRHRPPEGHLLDVMVKRLHEYKRQSLKLLHIVTLYDRLISGEVDRRRSRRARWSSAPRPPRVRDGQGDDLPHQLGGADVNNDPRVDGRLFVAFPPNYNVTLAEKLIPAADLSEQISLAGKEASARAT